MGFARPQEDELKLRVAMIMGTAIFMTAFLVEVKEARPETPPPCQGEPRSFGFAFISSTDETKTQRARQGVTCRAR